MRKLARLAGHFFVRDLSSRAALKGFFLQLLRRLGRGFLCRRWLTGLKEY
jgi:hypothetical protein